MILSNGGQRSELDEEPREGATLTRNEQPCRRCGYVYPWEGEPRQVALVLRITGGRCPACVCHRPPPVGWRNPYRQSRWRDET